MSSQAPKRRRLRKGTHSCWECKRRKMKCVFGPRDKAVCIGCGRRGSQCIGQELPEEVSLAAESIHPDRRRSGRRFNNALTPVSLASEICPDLEFYKASPHGTNIIRSYPKYESLSQFLHQALPPPDDLTKICRAKGVLNILTSQTFTLSYRSLADNGLQTAESLLVTPGPYSHPVMIARYMLKLVLFMHHFPPNMYEELELSEDTRTTVERLARLAIALVTTKDELLCSIEGLECVMLESAYQANTGNLRRSWVAGRRAMGIAQLMGLNRPDGRTQFHVIDKKALYDIRIMWLRIMFLDRHICLLLGLPEGSLDRTMDAGLAFDGDTESGQLEGIHCVLSSRILERNALKPGADNYSLTRGLDVELQKAARRLPSKWWLPPTLQGLEESEAVFWETRRVFTQVVHYNLLNQLHLPYMLRSSGGSRKNEYEYSRMTCVNASREVLVRFVNMRTFNRVAYVCRTLDFVALMSAMTLILAHLASKNLDTENLLAHQYLSDRAMIEKTQENMVAMNKVNSDALSAKSADLLGRLLALEASFEGSSQRARKVRVHETDGETELSDENDQDVVILNIPYFGTVRIASEGLRKEAPSNGDSGVGRANDIENASIPGRDGLTQPGAKSASVLEIWNADVDSETPLYDFADLMRHDELPELTARGEDWALQGADLAFFDSLMGTGDSGEGEVADWRL